MRIVFAGTPDFAAEALRRLLKTDHQVVGVYTQPDRPAGRGRKQQPGPVKQVAVDANLPVYQPLTLKSPDEQAQLAALNADVMVVAAYGLILPKAILETPRFGCLNIHASLLPRWRGAAPIHRAIAAGDTETGITIMQMDEGLDTGDMLLKLPTAILPDDTGGSLHDRLATLGGDALIQALQKLEDDQLRPEPQDNELATYAHKLRKEEGHLDWAKPAVELDRQIRAFNPWPGSYTDCDDQRIRVHEAEVLASSLQAVPGTVLSRTREGIDVSCGQDTLRLKRVQLPGTRAMSVSDLINGGRDVLITGQELR